MAFGKYLLGGLIESIPGMVRSTFVSLGGGNRFYVPLEERSIVMVSRAARDGFLQQRFYF